MINIYEKISISKKTMGFIKLKLILMNKFENKGYKYICIGTDLEFR